MNQPLNSRANSSNSSSDELDAFLSLVDSDNEYRVDEVLKESPFERTEKVSKVNLDGKVEGPFIRKYLDAGSGLGSVYQVIYEAQKQRSFTYIPKIYSCYCIKDNLVVVMGYVQGETLQDVIYRLDPSPSLAMDVFPRICAAVRELHEEFNPPIIHRDLKPSNIILSYGKLMLIDFGIARIYCDGSETDTVHFGTRDYAPPEQYGFGQTDQRSDIYALGMLLFYCFTERNADAKDRERKFAHAYIPDPFRQIIVRSCAFNPEDRFSNIRELEEVFNQACMEYFYSETKKTKNETKSKTKAPVALVTRSTGDLRLNQVAQSAQAVRLTTELQSTQSSQDQKRNSVSSVFARIPIGIGIAWNVLLGLSWLTIIIACFVACFNPDPSLPEVNYPLWFRIVEYFLFLGLSSTCICYELSDRRLLRRRFSALRQIPLLWEFVIIAVGAPFILAVSMTIAAQFVVSSGVPLSL